MENKIDNKIDREQIIRRHNPVYAGSMPVGGSEANVRVYAPLSVGNGAFCFTADWTGLQTFFDDFSYFPLCTMTEKPWGWHTYSDAEQSLRNADTLRLTPFESVVAGKRTMVGYPTDVIDDTGATGGTEQEKLFSDLRQNPHKAHLGKIAFVYADGAPIASADAVNVKQELSLYDGVIFSHWTLHGKSVAVETFVAPDSDTAWVHAQSELLLDTLAISVDFPQGSHKKNGADFQAPNVKRKISLAHNTTLSMRVTFGAGGADVHLADEREYVQAKDACKNFWQRYWEQGGFISFAPSAQKRREAQELERRIVLSQYLEAIQCRGTLPPAETALTCNSWYGKFHLEMHFWHSAHFIAWGRACEAKKSLPYYVRTLDDAKALAASQGYSGARYSKMCAPPHAGAALGEYLSPSSIAPLLVWQQPHPICLAELCYQAAQHSGDNAECDALLQSYRTVVAECARFMVSFLYDSSSGDENADGTLVFGPPVIPAQERHDPRTVRNPSFEVSYWKWGLLTAASWMTRLGETDSAAEFADAAKRIALPALGYAGDYAGDRGEGKVYLAAESCPNTFTQKPFFSDHPSMLLSFGMLPGNGDIDAAAMGRTLDTVLRVWDMESLWGWDFALLAMTAARLGRKDDAARFLLMDNPKNTYLPNGHNLQGGVADLPLYLPGNGSLLLACAMMATTDTFPSDFGVCAEGLCPYL
ncbi:MAG: hypothetical protein Ta2A_16810 [Treponemataceae bacterium]|nr:MAG: hypothetical protein Ta2A_16810 [Treponemataceae bacterium]